MYKRQLLTMAGGFAAQAASAGIDQSYVAPAAETASTLMSDSAFSDEARTCLLYTSRCV